MPFPDDSALAQAGGGPAAPTSGLSENFHAAAGVPAQAAARGRGSPAGAAVFVHATTIAALAPLWAQWRGDPNTRAFFEPFDPRLASLMRAEAEPGSSSTESPFREYHPLVKKAGGVRGFAPAMAGAWFVPKGGPRGQLRRREARYLGRLLGQAEGEGRTVLCGSQLALARLPALKDRFPGVHVLLRSDPARHWLALLRQRRAGAFGGIETMIGIVLCASDPFLAGLRSRYLSGSRLTRGATDSAQSLAAAFAAELPEADLFRIFAALRCYAGLIAESAADLTVDLARAAAEPAYRERAAADLAAATGLPVASAYLQAPESEENVIFPAEAVDWRALTAMMEEGALSLERLGAATDAVVHAAAFADALEEGLRAQDGGVAARAGAVLRETADASLASERIAAIQAERDWFAAERDAAITEQARLLRECDELIRLYEPLRREREARAAAQEGPVLVGDVAVPRDWPVGGEAARDFVRRLENGFFARYLAGEKVLDIGFRGYDGSAPILPHAIGIDLDYPGYDGVVLPFPDNSVDAVFSSHMLQHAGEWQAVIRDWHRVLKIGGFIVCIVPHQFLYEKKWTLPSRWNRDHKRFYTPGSLLREFEAALAPNSYRIRHLVDNDSGYTCDIPADRHAGGACEIELVVEKIRQPAWELDA